MADEFAAAHDCLLALTVESSDAQGSRIVPRSHEKEQHICLSMTKQARTQAHHFLAVRGRTKYLGQEVNNDVRQTAWLSSSLIANKRATMFVEA